MCSFHLDEGTWKVDYKFSLWRHRCLHHHGNNISEVVGNCPFASVIYTPYEYFFIIKIAPIIRSQQNLYPKVITHTYICQLYFHYQVVSFPLYIEGASQIWAVQSLDFFNLWRHQCLRLQHKWLYGLAQDRNILSALTMGILHSCAKPYNYIQNHLSTMHVYIPSLIMLFKFIYSTHSLFGRRVVVATCVCRSIIESVLPPVRPFPSSLLTRKLNQFI